MLAECTKAVGMPNPFLSHINLTKMVGAGLMVQIFLKLMAVYKLWEWMEHCLQKSLLVFWCKVLVTLSYLRRSF